ncbi:hypothetical protein [Bacillus benzoevorans]|uniref:Lipoprotein n=1 Tax=Bacillus benzoevorans TaxID=1456 RepID=A0A7X0HQ21_9BACI|nr:hypothetical protein [Bacillus benzoevorans]MBB6444833.1 hypothetical protein [Bacillus benzoevorans]
MQKRNVFTMVLLVLLFSLISCSKQDQDQSDKEIIVEKQEGDFELKLFSQKGRYAAHEKINIYAQVKYIGPKEEVMIEHGGFTPIKYEVVENKRGITIPTVESSILNQTTLKRNQWYTFKFEKSGEVKEDKFHQEYFNEEGFPKGSYTIEAAFSFQSDEEDRYRITGSGAAIVTGSIDIIVD